MAQIVFAPAAVRDLERLRAFLRPKSASAARRASAAIVDGVEALGRYPEMGRLIAGLPEEFREWFVEFGDSGYLVRYRFENRVVVILAVRHQREAGFQP